MFDLRVNYGKYTVLCTSDTNLEPNLRVINEGKQERFAEYSN